MEAAFFDCESTVTDRYQTTVPAEVRAALQIGKRDKLRYRVSPGAVLITRAVKPMREDPVLKSFLTFLAKDITKHPERLRVLDAGLRDRIHALVGDIDVDLDAPLNPADE
jgi:antitoxin PrlF